MKPVNEPQTELEKLGPKFSETVIGRTLMVATVAAGMFAAVGAAQHYHDTEKREVKELAQVGIFAQTQSQRILNESGDQKATDLFILKTVVQEKRDEMNSLVQNTVALREYLGWHEDRVERAASYDRMLENIQGKIAALEVQGDRPFQNLESRRMAQLTSVEQADRPGQSVDQVRLAKLNSMEQGDRPGQTIEDGRLDQIVDQQEGFAPKR